MSFSPQTRHQQKENRQSVPIIKKKIVRSAHSLWTCRCCDSNKRNKCCLSRLTTRTKQTLRAFEYLSNKSEDMQNVIDCRTRRKKRKQQVGDIFPFDTGTSSCRINNTLHSNIQTCPFPTYSTLTKCKQIKLGKTVHSLSK